MCEAPKSITHNNLKVRWFILEEKANLMVEVNARDCFFASYSIQMKLI